MEGGREGCKGGGSGGRAEGRELITTSMEGKMGRRGGARVDGSGAGEMTLCGEGKREMRERRERREEKGNVTDRTIQTQQNRSRACPGQHSYLWGWIPWRRLRP